MSDDNKRKVELSDIDSIMKTSQGKSFIMRLLEKTGYFDSIEHTDEAKLRSAVAKREIGVWLAQEMQEANPGQTANIIGRYYDE